MWLHSLKVAQLLRSAACLHTNQSRSYLNHLVKRLHIKIVNTIFINMQTNLSEYCVADYDVQKNPPLSIISLTKTIQSSQPISFKHQTSYYPPKSSKQLILLRFPKQTLYSLILYYMHATCHISVLSSC